MIALIICAIVVTCSIVAATLYLLFSFIPQLRRTLNFTEGEIKEGVKAISETVNEIKSELQHVSRAIDSLSDLMGSIQELNEDHVKPLVDNMNQIATSLNRSASKVEEVADETSRFAKKSLQLAAFYRDKLFVPVIEIVSFWSGMKSGFRSILKKEN